MALASLVLPPALLTAAAVLGWGLELGGVRAGRLVAAAGAWAALLLLCTTWLAGGRTPFEIATGATVAAEPLLVRLDPVVVLLQVIVLVPVALLLTFQRRTGNAAAAAALGTAAALAALAAGSVLLSALGLAICASIVLVLLEAEGPAASPGHWLTLTAGWLLLAWTAVLLEVRTGTSVYGAVPVTALQVPVFVLLALSAVLVAGLVPWRTWVPDVWTRPRLEAGSIAVALLVPLGFYPLVRAYGLGSGQWPSPWLNLALAALGAATALGAAVRAQAAPSRRGFLAEAVPLAAGFALLAAGLGTPLGLVAGLTALAGLAVAAGLAPLVPEGPGVVPLVAIALLVGVPPGLTFGGRLLGVQAALEAGTGTAFVGLAGVAAWLLGAAAAARALRLPPSAAGAGGGSTAGSLAAAGIGLAAGVAVTGLIALAVLPAVSQVMPAPAAAAQPAVSQAAILGPGSVAVVTASGSWAAVLLGGPLLALGLLAALLSRPLRSWAASDDASPRALVPLDVAPAPLFDPPLAGVPERGLRWLASFRLPEQYRSLFRPAVLERAAAGGRPWFWVAVSVVLAIAVTR